MTHPNNPRLVALTSPAMGSGKTTAAQHLVERHGFVRVSFASPLKGMAMALIQSAGVPVGTAHMMVYGDLKEKPIPALGGLTSRRVQQLLGTEFGRNHLGEDIWVRIALASVEAWHRFGRSVVIDDVRFRNEYDAIEASGGTVYRVVRPEAKLTTAAHASEGGLDGIAMPEIWNTSTVDDLKSAIERAVFA